VKLLSWLSKIPNRLYTGTRKSSHPRGVRRQIHMEKC